MLKRVIKFNERRDIKRVVGHLAVDVNDMLRTGIVPSGATNEETNGIEEPSQIIGMVRDVFSAIDMDRIIRKYGKKSPAKVAEAVKEGVASPSEPSNG